MPLLRELAEFSVELPHRDALRVQHLVFDHLLFCVENKGLSKLCGDSSGSSSGV